MVEEINANFYRAFEDRHRGSRELIKLRLCVYFPFVKPLFSYYDEAKALDLGCGRGEWLELLRETGFDAQGVDLDNNMLTACRERNLNVQTGDAVSFLKKIPDASLVVVTGFHIAEHIPFPDLQVLVEEALRVLKPGGLLILETPNPENIVVGATNFFLDPTHRHPIPPQLLSFLPEYYGFKRVKILRLQEPADLNRGKVLTLLDVLHGVSPDCAVVAQKTGEAEILAATDPAFEVQYGLTLENLTIRYDHQVESRAQQSEMKAQQAESKAEQAEAKANKLQTDLDTVHAANHRHWQLAEEREKQIQAILQSHSWRITAPLRGISSAIRRLGDPSNPDRFMLFRLLRFFFSFFRILFRNPFRLPGAIFGKIKHAMKRILLEVTRWLEKRPLLRKIAVLFLKPFPWLKKSLQKVIYISMNEQNAWQLHSKNVFPASNAEQVLSIDEILSRIRAEINESNEKKD